MAAIAPECSKVWRSKIAPKMMNRISNVMNRPWNVDAAMCLKSTRHTPHARATAATYTKGMATRAATRKAINRTPARRIGVTATRAWTVRLT
jgi:hypothetical protein